KKLTSGDVKPLGLSEADKNALVAFLVALTDDRVRYEKAPFDHPSLTVPNGPTLSAVGAARSATPAQRFLGLNPFPPSSYPDPDSPPSRERRRALRHRGGQGRPRGAGPKSCTSRDTGGPSSARPLRGLRPIERAAPLHAPGPRRPSTAPLGAGLRWKPWA